MTLDRCWNDVGTMLVTNVGDRTMVTSLICWWSILLSAPLFQNGTNIMNFDQNRLIFFKTSFFYLVFALDMNWVCISVKVKWFKSKPEFSIWSTFENFQSFIKNTTIVDKFPLWQIRILFGFPYFNYNTFSAFYWPGMLEKACYDRRSGKPSLLEPYFQ